MPCARKNSLTCTMWELGLLWSPPNGTWARKKSLAPFMHWCCTCYYTPCLYLHFQMKSFRCGAPSVQAPMANLASTLSISPRGMRAGPGLWELLPIGQKAWEICKHLSYKPAPTASAVYPCAWEMLYLCIAGLPASLDYLQPRDDISLHTCKKLLLLHMLALSVALHTELLLSYE